VKSSNINSEIEYMSIHNSSQAASLVNLSEKSPAVQTYGVKKPAATVTSEKALLPKQPKIPTTTTPAVKSAKSVPQVTDKKAADKKADLTLDG
jgi:hypothetical protein